MCCLDPSFPNSTIGYYYLDRETEEMLTAIDLIEPHTTLAVHPTEWNGPEQRTSDRIGEIKYTAPFLHVAALYCLEKDVAYMSNYEAGLPYFPINYRSGWLTDTYRSSADYVLGWRYRDHTDLEAMARDSGQPKLVGNYDRIHTGKHFSLYRRKRGDDQRFLSSPESALRFDMQPRNGILRPGYTPVFRDTLFSDEGYGWATRLERYERTFTATAEDDCIMSQFDGVFRVALPNGTYRVKSRFRAEAYSYRLSIIANGERVVRNQMVQTGVEPIEVSFSVTVTDEQLTQVVYAKERTHKAGWCWMDCTIRQR